MKNILMIILAAAGAAVLVSAAGCGGEEVAEAPVRPVRAVLLQQTAGVETREFPAVVQPARETPVSFRVGGPILRMAVAQGDRIAAGDPIAVLDPRDYEIARAAAAARAAELQARLERIRGMYEDGNAARADLDRVQAGRDMAAAELEAAENALRDTRLLAPFAGVVGLELAEEGQIVKAGQPVATLMDEAGWEVRAGIPEGLMVSAADFSDFGVSLDSHPGREFPARLKELGDRPGAGLQSYPLVVTPELGGARPFLVRRRKRRRVRAAGLGALQPGKRPQQGLDLRSRNRRGRLARGRARRRGGRRRGRSRGPAGGRMDRHRGRASSDRRPAGALAR